MAAARLLLVVALVAVSWVLGAQAASARGGVPPQPAPAPAQPAPAPAQPPAPEQPKADAPKAAEGGEKKEAPKEGKAEEGKAEEHPEEHHEEPDHRGGDRGHDDEPEEDELYRSHRGHRRHDDDDDDRRGGRRGGGRGRGRRWERRRYRHWKGHDEEDENPTHRHHYNDHGEHDSDYDHDAILGSHEETERYKKMTPEQAKENLGALVKKMDLNSDNFIDKAELEKWVGQSFRQLNKEEALKTFDKQDENQDGNVTFPEHFTESYGGEFDDKSIKAMKKDDPVLYAEMLEDAKRFNQSDDNKDGNLNQTEFVVFMYAWNYPHMHGYLVANEMLKNDKNKDNAMDFEEILAAHKLENATEEEKKKEKEEFDKYDLNKDGLLQPMEYKEMLVNEHTHRAQVVEETDIWVGSSVSSHKKAVAQGFEPWSAKLSHPHEPAEPEQEDDDEDGHYRRYYERDEL